MTEWHALGPATFTIGEPGTDYAGEARNFFITHAYEEVGDTRTMLDGTKRFAPETRADGLRADFENDLTAAGLYAYLYTNDLTTVPVTFTLIDGGAAWTGTAKLHLPADIGADEFGAPVVSSVEWRADLTFTPAIVVPLTTTQPGEPTEPEPATEVIDDADLL